MAGSEATTSIASDEYEAVDRSAASGTRPRSDALVMFGASGDLAHKKLFPAVYRLHRRKLLGVPVVGVALDPWTDDEMRTTARKAIQHAGEKFDEKAFDELAATMHFVSGD